MTLTRRSIIRGAGAAGSLLAAGGLPLWARGEQPPGEPAPPGYLRLSAALLGIEAARLEPEARAGDVPLADTFHELCREAAPAATAALLAAWRETAPRGAAAAWQAVWRRRAARLRQAARRNWRRPGACLPTGGGPGRTKSARSPD